MSEFLIAPQRLFYRGQKFPSRATHYCDPEIENMIDRQSMEPDQAKRKKLVWEIDSKLQQAVARPIEFYLRKATCCNSSYNGWRFEDVWLDK